MQHGSATRRPSPPALAIFARSPFPGRVKTRLIPLLGKQAAAEFQAVLIRDTLRKVAAVRRPLCRYLFWGGRSFCISPGRFVLAHQRGAGLGERLEDAFRKLLCHHPRAVVVGTDSPLVLPRVLREALDELRVCDAVLGPCPDGGYYLVGLRRLARGVFRNVRWGTASAFRDTLRNLLERGYSCSILEVRSDVDVPEDVKRLKRELARHRAARRLAPSSWEFLKRFRF